MFDRTACPDPELLAAQPFVSIDALAALSALLDLALKDRTPSAALLSGASRASHDQNRGETHVTRDGNARERIPTQSTTACLKLRFPCRYLVGMDVEMLRQLGDGSVALDGGLSHLRLEGR
jgi:hypothetical protein